MNTQGYLGRFDELPPEIVADYTARAAKLGVDLAGRVALSYEEVGLVFGWTANNVRQKVWLGQIPKVRLDKTVSVPTTWVLAVMAELDAGQDRLAPTVGKDGNLEALRLGYSPKEASQLIGMDLRAFYRYVASGQIPSKRIGCRIRVPADFMDQLPTRYTAEAPKPAPDAQELERADLPTGVDRRVR